MRANAIAIALCSVLLALGPPVGWTVFAVVFAVLNVGAVVDRLVRP